MGPTDHDRPSVRGLVASWLTLTRTLLSACADRGADAVQDALISLGRGPGQGGPLALPLPPLDPEPFAAALRDRVEQVAREAAEVINEEPSGCWTAETQQRVFALFEGLAEEALTRALDLRLAALESGLEGQSPEALGWVTKYLRMRATTGNGSPNAADHPTDDA